MKGKGRKIGLPHKSFVKRKPEPCGIEISNAMCASTGIMLFLEMNEGKDKAPDVFDQVLYFYIYLC